MSSARVLVSRPLNPHSSVWYRSLRRQQSTASTPNPARPQGFLRRNRSPLIWGVLSLVLGATGGQVVAHTIAPPPFPEPGSREDGILMADLNQRIDEEFKVKTLRGKCLGVSRQLRGEESRWVEVIPLPADALGEKKADGSLISQMQGAKGLGVQRMFWNKGEEKLIAVIWFGGALSGWPGVTHGGAIATQLAEKLSLAAALANSEQTDMLAAATPQRLPGKGSHAKMLAPATTPDEPAQLSFSYAKPTHANSFYVIRVSPSIPMDQDPDHVVPKEPFGGPEFEATLETMDARVCVKASARFAPSTAAQRVERNVTEGARDTYAELKKWLWPSRQESSQMG